MKLNDEQKFAALIHRHKDMANLLIVLTNLDIKIFIGFLTLQMALPFAIRCKSIVRPYLNFDIFISSKGSIFIS